MNYKNAEINLTINLEGCLATRGKHAVSPKLDDKGKQVFSIEKNDKGEIVKEPVFSLKTLQLPKTSECTFVTNLSNEFVQWALSEESKPKKASFQFWKNLPLKAKLHYHIKKFVEDQHGKVEFSYTVLE